MNTEKDNKQGAQGKHTSGPWVAGGSLISGEAGVTIARVLRRPAIYGGQAYNFSDTDRDAPEHGVMADANARLIAAAPDLLEACEAVLLRDDVANDEIGDILRAAIAKAKGQ